MKLPIGDQSILNRRTRQRLGAVEFKILNAFSETIDITSASLRSSKNLRVFQKNLRKLDATRSARSRALKSLVEKHWLLKDDGVIRISKEGKRALTRAVANLASSKRSFKDWDGMLRVVAFDIPEVSRKSRESLRIVLKRAGFLQLQQSLWVHPCDCEELIELLDSDDRLNKRVLLLTVSTISEVAKIKKHFQLRMKEGR